MKKWEYLFYDLTINENNSFLVEGGRMKKAGKEGWELVTTISRKENIVLIFKRQI